MHFQYKVIKFVLGDIKILYPTTLEMKKTHKVVQSLEKWKFTTCAPLKILLTENQDCLPLWHIVNNVIPCIKERKFLDFRLDICPCRW